MPNFTFKLALSAAQTKSIYAGQARAILVESEQGLSLRLPASNFRTHVNAEGINGRFSVDIDDNNKIQALVKL